MLVFAVSVLFSSCQDKQCNLSVSVNNPAYGSVTGGGVYDRNSSVVITAIPNPGYEFLSWEDGNVDNPRTVVLTDDAFYTAVFMPVVADGATVTFQNEIWNSNVIYAKNYSSSGYITLYILKDAYTSPSNYDAMLKGDISIYSGSYTYQNSEHYFNYHDPDRIYVDNSGILGTSGTQYFYWQPVKSSYKETITTIDLNNKIVTGHISQDFYSIEDYINNNLSLPGNLYPLTCTLYNASWSWSSASK